MRITLAELSVGQAIPSQTFPLDRAALVRYAGASGDFNPIHWSQETAESVGLPNVIAHGMLTMATAVRVVTDWLGDPGAVLEYGVRFTRPVVVEFGSPTDLEVTGSIRAIDAEGGTAEIDLTASANGQTVLAKSRVTVRVLAR